MIMAKMNKREEDLKKINELANTEKSKPEVEKDSQGNVIRVVTRSVVINNIPHGEPQPPQRLTCLNCQFACFIKAKADIENFCKYRFRNVYSMENTQDEDIIEDCDVDLLYENIIEEFEQFEVSKYFIQNTSYLQAVKDYFNKA